MTLEPDRLLMLAHSPVADVLSYLPGQVAASSRSRQWPGLLVWLQSGAAGELYVPPLFHHALVIKLDRPCASLQMRISREIPTVPQRMERIQWNCGDISIVPAGEAAYFSRETGSDNLHLHIEPELLARHAAARMPASAATVALDSHFVVRDERLRLLAMTLLEVLRHPAADDLLFVECMGQTLAAHLLERYTRFVEHAASVPRIDERQLRMVSEFVEANLDQPLSLECIADVLGMSRWHFAHCFKHTTGKSPHRYVTERRMQRALSLLSRTQRPVIDIALDVGFPDPAHFSRTFKRHYGVSPKTYRLAN